ncbi:MAG TPA: TonB-dependent receptor [Bryobacteraceae bacterium]|nr:TonB-dependent receptor [Bryobacteraceae bacterium]
MSKRVFKEVTKRFFSAAIALALICPVGTMPLRAQNGSGTLAGTIVDQVSKAIQGASITVKSESGSVIGTTTSDPSGHFALNNLATGSYTVEATSPGFARNTRLRVPVSASGSPDISITLNVDAISQSVTVQETVVLAADTAPQGNTLDATSARTEITPAVIQNFMAPVADFAEVIEQAPGAFSTNPNGIGLGQGKSYFRGFSDGQYTLTFDGIPFEDTNSPTHHSWASFPKQWISSTDFDRSPGQASDFGPTNFGGSINMKSPELQADPDIRGTFTIGSFNTKLYSMDFESGLLGRKKADAVLFNINAMTSDGYQTFNYQQRDAGYGKYQHRFSDRTSLSLYGGVVDIWNNTPNTTNPTRAQVASFGDNYLMNNTPLLANGTPDPYYYGYNTYHVQTDFEYAAFKSELGRGWTIDTKAYTTRYWNKQFYQNGATVNLTSAKPSGVDKLNGYRHAGDTLIVSKGTKWGVFRTGMWYDWAYTDRYQFPSNTITQVNTPLGNFHEHFITQTYQPFAEFEWHATPKLVVTAGIKAADYNMHLNQYQDNGKTVGCLGGVACTYPSTAGIWAGAPSCNGGVQFATHGINYNNWLPTLTARYRVWKQWSVYGQFAEGSVIPVSSVFDVPGGNVLTPPKPTLAKTYQAGSVLKLNRFTLDVDYYYVHFQNGYDSYTDPTTNEPVFVATGPSNTKGIEAEAHYAFGHGLSIYGNVTAGSAKYQTGPNYPNGGMWVANTPSNIEGLNLLWQHRSFDAGVTYKRVGQYYGDNGSLNYKINGLTLPYPVDQAFTIKPWELVNVFVNYTIKDSSHFRGTKIQLAVNNLADSHSLVGINPGVAPTLATPYVQSPSDLLNLLPGRSISLTITGGWAPKR